MPSTTKTAPKRIVHKGYTKSPRVNYQRFYAIKFCIELEQQNARAIRAFFNISDATYYRINNSTDFADYRRIIGSTNGKVVQPAPTDAPKTLGTARITSKPAPVLAPADSTLDKAKEVLELAQTVLTQANQANAKRGFFGGRRG